jgi:hypothetical protein
MTPVNIGSSAAGGGGTGLFGGSGILSFANADAGDKDYLMVCQE